MSGNRAQRGVFIDAGPKCRTSLLQPEIE